MLGTVKKPSLKRRPESGPPVTKKLKTDTGIIKVTEKNTEPAKTEIKVKPKKLGVNSKPHVKSFKNKNGLKSKPVFANIAKNKSFSKKSDAGSDKVTSAVTEGKPNWVEIKQEKKQQKVARKEKKHGLEVFELSIKAKALWEKLRAKSTDVNLKKDICQELFDLVKNDVGMLIHSHDLARVIQSVIKYGTAEMRSHIGDKLCQCFVKAATSKYGKFCVKSLLKRCSATTDRALTTCMMGHVVKLFCHKFGNDIVEYIYTVRASAPTRRAMRMEFYGDLGKLLEVPPTNNHLLDELPVDLKPAILSASKLNIMKVLDKKHLAKSSLVHAVLLDFLKVCEKQDRDEVLEAVHTEVESLCTSSEGQKVAILTLWHGTNKMKKVAVKSVKGKVKQFAESEFGHSFIMAMVDSVDDTVLLNKVIIPELLADLEELVKNEYGRRVILYLVAHRHPAYFHPQQLNFLKEGDSVRNSKKDDTLRLKELLSVLSKSILKKMVSDPGLWCKDESIAMVTLAVFQSAEAGKILSSAYGAFVDFILDPESKVEQTKPEAAEVHAVEGLGTHKIIKKIMQQEKDKGETGQNTLAKSLVDKLTEENIAFLVQFNRGAFTLVFVLENGDEETVGKLKSKLGNVIKMLKKMKSKSKGAEILFKKMEELK